MLVVHKVGGRLGELHEGAELDGGVVQDGGGALVVQAHGEQWSVFDDTGMIETGYLSRVGNGSGLGWWHHSCSRMTFQGWRQRQGAGRHVKPGLHGVY